MVACLCLKQRFTKDGNVSFADDLSGLAWQHRRSICFACLRARPARRRCSINEMERDADTWQSELLDAFVLLARNSDRVVGHEGLPVGCTVEGLAEVCALVEVLAPLPFPDSLARFDELRPGLTDFWQRIPRSIVKAVLRPQKDSTPTEEAEHAHLVVEIRRIPMTLMKRWFRWTRSSGASQLGRWE